MTDPILYLARTLALSLALLTLLIGAGWVVLTAIDWARGPGGRR